MRLTMRQFRLSGVLAAALLFGLASTGWAQQQGTIEGRVIDRATRLPLAGVQVTLGATTRGAVTTADGRFRIERVPVGDVELRARFIGYTLVSITVTVRANETATADFELQSSAVLLEAQVVTASGAQQAARSIPNAVATVTLGDVAQTAPITNMADALNARGGGVLVTPSSGTTGGGARIRIRGANSVSLSNEPVIIVDGIRVASEASSNTVGVGGQVPSRINDINPDDIESYQVFKGPAAAGSYGTGAANGAIRYRTKRGSPGPTRWTAFVEGGGFPYFKDWPDNVFGFDPTKSVAVPAERALRYGCTLPRVSLGQCTQGGGLVMLNPLRDDSPFRNGSRQQFGASMSGGSDQTTFYVSGDVEEEDGIYRTSSAKRYNFRANITNRPSDKLELAITTGYVSSDLRLPDNDNNALGFLGSGLLGGSDTLRRGWGFLLPEESYKIITNQGVERFTSSVAADAHPWSFLTARAVIGLDVTNRLDARTFPPNQVPFNATTLEGSRTANSVAQYNYTANVSATARFELSPTITSLTTAGAQYFRERSQTVFASGRKLAGGTTSLSGIGIPTVSESNVEAKTFGLFIEEQIGVSNRIFFTVALRGDDNSAFGKNFDFITYPKIGASWVISEEGFFPGGLVSSLRLRGAYGASGLQPGTTDALLFFDPVAVTADNADVVAFQIGNLGNPDLKPEKSREVELGFDAGLFDDRFRLVFSYYDKASRDALINRPLAPSLGVTNAQFFNLGEVSNKGVEIELSGRLLNRPNALWDFTFSAWGNRNRLIDLGTDFLGADIPPIVFGNQRHVEGYPLGGYWGRKIQSFNDANSDGIITSTEVTLDPTFSYMGTPYPTQGATLSTGITLGRRVRISGLLDYRAGHHLDNLTAAFRCGLNICPEINDPTTPLERQAEAVASVFLGSPQGYIEDADFLKLRELAVTYYFPASVAGRFGASGMSLTVAGRNLATWTGYSGFDPEVNGQGQANFSTRDFLTQPPVRFFTARVNVTF